MIRGTFANIRIRNQLVPGIEGGLTRHLPSGEPLTIYDAAMRYRNEGVPLVILAGQDMGQAAVGIGPPKARICLECGPCSPPATNGFIAVISWEWACCRWNSSPARRGNRLA